MIFSDYIPAEIRDAAILKIKAISDYLGIQPDWLSAVIFKESGHNPHAVNKQKGDEADAYNRSAYRATGLIQFMPTTAAGLGTTTQALYMMNYLQQLDYVKKYFAPVRNKIKSYPELYLYTFYPAAIGKPDTYVIGSPGSKTVQQNKVIDLNEDGVITKSEFIEYTYKQIPEMYLDILKKKV